MSNIEPTEEQKQAAREACWSLNGSLHHNVARLLAEREAKFRARVAELEAKIADAVFSCPGCGRHDFGFFASQIKAACGPCRTRAEAAEAREAQHIARIAELETVYESYREARARIAEMEEANVLLQRAYSLACNERNALTEREAQHLADIMALREVLNDGLNDPNDIGEEAARDAARALLQRLAHYDDAKAAEYFDKAREVAREVAAWPDWKKAGFRPCLPEGGEG